MGKAKSKGKVKPKHTVEKQLPRHLERRNFYRIEYLEADAPILLISGVHLKISNLSEEGLKFNPGIQTAFTVGTEVTGSLTFRDTESFLIHGTILRLLNKTVVVRLKKPFPLRKIIEEQRVLILKYAHQE